MCLVSSIGYIDSFQLFWVVWSYYLGVGVRGENFFRGGRGPLGNFGEAFPPKFWGFGAQTASIDAVRRVLLSFCIHKRGCIGDLLSKNKNFWSEWDSNPSVFVARTPS